MALGRITKQGLAIEEEDKIGAGQFGHCVSFIDLPRRCLLEIVDVQDKILTRSCTECANSKQCAPYKHHYDECVERVTRNSEDPDFKGPHEDCVEECKCYFLSYFPYGSSSGSGS